MVNTRSGASTSANIPVARMEKQAHNAAKTQYQTLDHFENPHNGDRSSTLAANPIEQSNVMQMMQRMMEMLQQQQQEMQQQRQEISELQQEVQKQQSQQHPNPPPHPLPLGLSQQHLPQQPTLVEQSPPSQQQREDPRGKDRQIELLGFSEFRKLQPPVFIGNRDSMDAEEWAMTIEKIFTAIQCMEEQKVSYASFMFRGEAERWWRSISRTHQLGEAQPMAWADFLQVFYEKYFPASIRDQKEVEFINLTQGNLSITDYEEKFTELLRFAPVYANDEEARAKKFLRGLKLNIRNKLAALNLTDYHVIVDRARRVEMENEEFVRIHDSRKWLGRGQSSKMENEGFEMLCGNRKWSGRGQSTETPNRRRYTHKTLSGTPPKLLSQQRLKKKCLTCKKLHSGICLQDTKCCFKCGKQGHKIVNCPEGMGKGQVLQMPPVNQPPTWTAPAQQNNRGKRGPMNQGRVYMLTQQEAQASEEVVTGGVQMESIVD